MMGVYIDKATIPYGRMKMSHMNADTLHELHAMADRLRIDRKHFQDKPGKPHYDICQWKKKYAIFYGAKEVGRHEFMSVFDKHKPVSNYITDLFKQ